MKKKKFLMKKVKALLFAILLNVPLTILAQDVQINEMNFPDENFRNYLLEQSYGKDGVITEEEIKKITFLGILIENISSLQGIEYFTALEELLCSANKISTLDVSKNTALTKLSCYDNQLKTLDLSKNTALKELNCRGNQLISLNVSGCTALTELSCYKNQLTTLDVSNCTSLTDLRCYSNLLTTLNVSNCTSLTDLRCYNNLLTTLDLSKNETLSYLDCQLNKLRTLELPKSTALESLNCFGNQLTNLNVSGCTVLTTLSCDYNQLTNLNVSGCTVLTTLDCDNNLLTDLNVSGCTALKTLDSDYNQLTNLNVSGCAALVNLKCHGNLLTTLDVSGCAALTFIDCSHNKIKATAMDTLIASLPQNSGSLQVYNFDYDSNVCTKKQVATAKTKGWTIYYTINGLAWLEYEGCDEPITIDEINFPDVNFRGYLLAQDYGADEVLTEKEIKNITSIDVHGQNISSLKGIELFTALTNLNCANNQLTALDVSKNTALVSIDCSRNKIKGAAMDALISCLPQKTSGSLRVHDNRNSDEGNVCTKEQVEAAKAKGWTAYYFDDGTWKVYEGYVEKPSGIDIDMTNFPDANFRSYLLAQEYGKDEVLTEEEIKSITSIDVHGQSISSLKGIEHFTALTNLNCANNQLTTLDVSKNTALVSIDCSHNQIKGASMDAMIKNLPQTSNGSLRVYDKAKTDEGNVCTIAQVVAAKAKGWTAYYYNAGNWQEYEGYYELAINATNFPDANFRNYLLGQSYGKDGVLTEEEIMGITSIDVWNKNITSLEGIEHFTALQELNCYSNRLTALDVSKNTALRFLYCYNNQLTTLNVSGCTNLEGLNCSDNLLTTLDVSNNTKLEVLECYSNRLTALDVSKNTALAIVFCYHNQLTGSSMEALTGSLPQTVNGDLYVYNDVEFEEGNICTKKHITAAKARGWMPYWYNGSQWVSYKGNEPGLAIDIDEANFPDANFRSYLLAQDYGKDNVLTEAEIMGVTSIDVNGQEISSLKGIEYFTALSKLNCGNNLLATLSISANTALTTLNCINNQLTALDVSKNTKLTELRCSNNRLTTIDLSKNTALEALYCYGNQLTALNVSKNAKITQVNCSRNQIYDAQMDALIGSLPQTSKGSLYVFNSQETDEGNVCTKKQVAAAKAKGWTVYYTANGLTWLGYEGSANAAEEPVSITLPAMETVNVNKTIQLTPTIEPADAVTELTWASDDETIAKVTSSGMVAGIKAGTAIITVRTSNGLKAECFVIVEDPTGIEDVKADGRTNVPIYTVSGQKVTGSLKGKKGVYIVGGKKVVIK